MSEETTKPPIPPKIASRFAPGAPRPVSAPPRVERPPAIPSPAPIRREDSPGSKQREPIRPREPSRKQSWLPAVTTVLLVIVIAVAFWVKWKRESDVLRYQPSESSPSSEIRPSVAPPPPAPQRPLPPEPIDWRSEFGAAIQPLQTRLSGISDALSAQMRRIEELDGRMKELDGISRTTRTLAESLSTSSTAAPPPSVALSPEASRRMDELQQAVGEIHQSVGRQFAQIDDLGSQIKKVNEMKRVVDELADELSKLQKREKPPAAAPSAELAGQVVHLQQSLQEVKNSLRVQGDEIGEIGVLLSGLSRLQTNTNPAVSQTNLNAGLSEDAEMPQTPGTDFEKGTAVLAPSTFSLEREPALWIDPRCYSPARTALREGSKSVYSPADSRLGAQR